MNMDKILSKLHSRLYVCGSLYRYNYKRTQVYSSANTQAIRCVYFTTLKTDTKQGNIKKKILNDPSFRVRIIPTLNDNYTYIITDTSNHTMVVVDPGEGEKVINVLQEEEKKENKLLAILNTHRHHDHVGGNEAIVEKYPNIIVGGPATEPIPAINKFLDHGDQLQFGGTKIQAVKVPCHTKGHLVYIVTGDSERPPLLFSGDTLFLAGCGRFFEGTPADMYDALYNKIAVLPRNTRVYCGHEYSLVNLRFALTLDPSNIALREKFAAVKILRSKGLPSVPSTLEEELSYNPFLRVHESVIQDAIGDTDPIVILKRLRQRRTDFE